MLSKDMKNMKEFLQFRDNWEINEVIENIIEETNLLKHKDLQLAKDECSIIWGTLNNNCDHICGFDDFINEYTKIFIKMICNVIDSYNVEESDKIND